MKKLTYSGASLALLSLLILAPTLTYAQIDINSEATGTLDADMDLTATSGDSVLEVDLGTDASATTTEEDENATTSDEEEGEGELSLRLNADGVAITSAADVESEADLEVFAYNVAAQEEMIDETHAEATADGKSRVEVVYKHYGELFGIMPIVVKSTTIVTTGDGEVEVESDLPWWSFLLTSKNHAASEIESRIKDNPTVMMSAEMETDAALQAELIEAVVAELSAHSSLHTSLNI